MTVKLNLVSCSFFANVRETLGAISPFTESAAFGVSIDGSLGNFDIWLLKLLQQVDRRSKETVAHGDGPSISYQGGSQQGFTGKAFLAPDAVPDTQAKHMRSSGSLR